jgi:starch phosphorylase
VSSETISKILYPSDSFEAGRELRLLQEYFLVACAVRDIVRRHLAHHADCRNLADQAAIQLNDTHPAPAVAELMRLLVDEQALPWDQAWEISRATLGYTNHTLMPEALERWPVSLLERLLPRHLQIIYEINRRLLEQVEATWPGDGERQRRMSIIEEGDFRNVRMGHLAVVGAHAVNGVAALHSRLITTALFPEFHALWPERFSNKTNGITPRRWLLAANPGLAALVNRSIGDAWITDLDRLRELEGHADDPAFQAEFRKIKGVNKTRLASLILRLTRTTVDPDSLFDVHVKRIHEYKRQLLNVMHIMHQYLEIVEDGRPPPSSKTYVFAGKAAPGYFLAKLVIKLITSVAAVVNAEPRCRDHLRVVFLPDYRVTLAETIIPAADLSEQISTVGTEASGTSNMKFALNGALTIGTADGANIEIAEEVGAEHLYLFGLTVDQAQALATGGAYRPSEYRERSPALRRLLDALESGRFSSGSTDLFRPIRDRLLEHGDPYLHLADFESYAAAHQRAAQDYRDRDTWTRKTVLTVARMGRFSSDRTIREYARDIWSLRPVPA